MELQNKFEEVINRLLIVPALNLEISDRKNIAKECVKICLEKLNNLESIILLKQTFNELLCYSNNDELKVRIEEFLNSIENESME